MFEKPGIQRGVPMAIIGFIVGIGVLQFVRTLQQMDPIWDPQVAFVVIPFFIVGFFMWGMGAFDPRMSEHPHGPEDVAIVPADEAHPETTTGPFGLLMSQFWVVSFAVILVVLVLFALATAPTGLFLQTVNQAEGNVAAIETDQAFLLPLGVDTVEASQLSVFLAFIIFTLVSILVVAGVLGIALYFLNGEVLHVEGEATAEERRPPAPVRAVGRFLTNIARGLRRGLPRFFGYRN